MYKVRTYNQIAVSGLDRFPRQSYEVGSDIAHPDAFLLRSQKLHDVEVSLRRSRSPWWSRPRWRWRQ